ncbi:hypothetical protein CHU98_g3501 [Xylaria longipes]|nr:hypothetical protein CHU98_g3501 [Xylaria longipes]
MFSTKSLALVFFVTNPILAGTPLGYGYGDMTDTIVGASTDSPVYTETPYSIEPITVTDSITLTKPTTVTVTHTVTVSRPKCSLEITTISGTTSTTLTTRISIFIPQGPSSRTITIETSEAPGFSGADVSTATTNTLTVSTTGFVVSDTTASCESTTTTADVDGVTGSSSSTPTTSCESTATTAADVDGVTGSSSRSASTLSVGPVLGTSGVGSGASNGTASFAATRTSSSTTPLSTIVTSIGGQGMVVPRVLAGAVGLASLILPTSKTNAVGVSWERSA